MGFVRLGYLKNDMCNDRKQIFSTDKLPFALWKCLVELIDLKMDVVRATRKVSNHGKAKACVIAALAYRAMGWINKIDKKDGGYHSGSHHIINGIIL